MNKGKSLAYKIFMTGIALLSLGTTSCSLFGINQSRTYYDTLDLKTPEKAVKTFIKAYEERDFWTAWLVLSTRTQFVYHQRVNLLDYRELLKYESRSELVENIPILSQKLPGGEHSLGDIGYFFDALMLAASEHDMLLFDLSGVVVITSSTPTSIPTGSSGSSTEDAVDVTANVGKVQGIIFRMVQAPSGKWRVYQVILPGCDDHSDFSHIPWCIPAE